MNRLTRLEIQRALLAGEPLAWTDRAGKAAVILLSTAPQRRLFEYLLKSGVREPKGLSDVFTKGLGTAHAEGIDPSVVSGALASNASGGGPWKLQKIESEGFGGLNTPGGPPFVLRLDGESFLLQGPNGSGKSSLIGAVLWAMTGERYRDHSEARPEARADVFGPDDRPVGTWPPIACYPNEAAQLKGEPFVKVTLTFAGHGGAIATVERVLKDGVVSESTGSGFTVPDILIETGLLMPSRMPQIRFEKGQTRLTDAVQTLTGLDDLIDIGLLVEGLCHKSREYLATNAKEVSHHRDLFDAALAEARRSLSPTGMAVAAYVPKDTADKDGALAVFGRQLSQRATELTQVVADDLVKDLDLGNPKIQQEVSGAISGAREDLVGGLGAIEPWKELSTIEAALRGEPGSILKDAVRAAERQLAEALDLDHKIESDNRFQLKALGAQWHEAHREGPVSNCPLCEVGLSERAALAAELETLRRSGVAATRLLSDNANAILSELDAAIPIGVRRILPDIASLAPRQALIAALTERFVDRERYLRHLGTFTQLVREALKKVPDAELPVTAAASAVDGGDPTSALRARIAAAQRLAGLAEWVTDQAPSWNRWWTEIAGAPVRQADAPEAANSDAPDLGGDAEMAAESLFDHLDRLGAAIGEAEPYRLAAAALRRAWESGKDAWIFEKTQKQREAVANDLAPLKLLGSLAEAQARQAIDQLSEEIAGILQRIQVSEPLRFRGAHYERKAGLVVRAGFQESLKIDATLVANTSWLRAVLWAFLFALRQEAVKQLTSDPFPLLFLDDPQATFDVEHRHRWTREIVGLQQGASKVQVLLTTHDEAFLELAKVDGVEGREAIIAAAGPELGHVGVFEGASLARKWADTRKSNTPQAGRDYMIATRIYIEGMLQLMLRGESASVSAVSTGFVLGDSREKLDQLNKAGNAPWNKPEFKKLVGQLGKGLPTIKHMEIAHHANGNHLGMSEAEDVAAHWLDKLQPALDRAFRLGREHQLLHGGLKALQARSPTCSLPDGYQNKVGSLRLPVLGRAAALTDGRAADGRMDFTIGPPSETLVFGRHVAYRLSAATMEPVARRGDILLVEEVREASPRSLVVARLEDRLLARRFEISDNHSDVAVLTAQSVNPNSLAAPLVIKRGTLEVQKVVGVLFDYAPALLPSDQNEVCDCGGEAAIHQLTAGLLGVVEVAGQSAEPLALDKQLLLVGSPVSATEALSRLEGRPVVASDGADNRYFKRLRAAGPSNAVLESLEIGGDSPPILLTHATGATTDLGEVWPVMGVLFSRPS